MRQMEFMATDECDEKIRLTKNFRSARDEYFRRLQLINSGAVLLMGDLGDGTAARERVRLQAEEAWQILDNHKWEHGC